MNVMNDEFVEKKPITFFKSKKEEKRRREAQFPGFAKKEGKTSSSVQENFTSK